MSNYEESRKQRMEENKRRMEELNLLSLATSIKISSKSSLSKKKVVETKSRSVMPVRRSSRVADKPQPNYKEFMADPIERSNRVYKRRDLLDRKYAPDEDRRLAIDRAERLQSALTSEFPTFIKPLKQSHTTGGFWLGLPHDFCETYLPAYDETITLTDTNGDKWETKYLGAKTGLSGGWRGFSLDHDLVDGDALVFQLINPSTFKVFIIRVYAGEESDDQDIVEGNKDNNNDGEEQPSAHDTKTELQRKRARSASSAAKMHNSAKPARSGPKQKEKMEALPMRAVAM